MTRSKTTSAECTAAEALDWPEQHRRCAGNTVVRLPDDRPEQTPVLTCHCGCTCHAGQAQQTVYIGRRDAAPIPPGRAL